MTAVQPAASAAASLRVIIADGKFHGVKIDTTPNDPSISLEMATQNEYTYLSAA